MNGWTVRKTTTTGISFNGTFSGLMIHSGESVIIALMQERQSNGTVNDC